VAARNTWISDCDQRQEVSVVSFRRLETESETGGRSSLLDDCPTSRKRVTKPQIRNTHMGTISTHSLVPPFREHKSHPIGVEKNVQMRNAAPACAARWSPAAPGAGRRGDLRPLLAGRRLRPGSCGVRESDRRHLTALAAISDSEPWRQAAAVAAVAFAAVVVRGLRPALRRARPDGARRGLLPNFGRAFREPAGSVRSPRRSSLSRALRPPGRRRRPFAADKQISALARGEAEAEDRRLLDQPALLAVERVDGASARCFLSLVHFFRTFR
jgi:hypothetical protein